jgi:outer membrane protein assembly factor BamB
MRKFNKAPAGVVVLFVMSFLMGCQTTSSEPKPAIVAAHLTDIHLRKQCDSVNRFQTFATQMRKNHPAGGDWPMWRYDAQRSGACPTELPKQLHLQWSRQLSPPQPAFPGEPRLCFDASYEPVAMGGTLFVPSMVNDSVTAIDTGSGKIKWRFYTEGPVRFAPAAGPDKVYFVCDDGYLYCVDSQTGDLVWQFKAGPADATARKLLGNSRLISRWPARGGVVLADDVVYFAAGVFPFEGVYVYAIEAKTGSIVWENKDSGFIKRGMNDHGGFRDGGLSPQGYLAITNDKVIVPNGKALPVFFDRKTGQIDPYNPAWGGRTILEKGCWYVSAMGNYFLQSGDVYDLETRRRLQIDPGQSFKELGDFREPVFTAEAMYYSEPINEQPSGDYRGYRPVGQGYEKIIAYDITKTGLEEKQDKLSGYSVTTWKSLTFEKIFEFESDLKVHLKSGSQLYAGAENQVAAVDIPAASKQPTISWRADIEGTPHRMLTADDRLFVVTNEGAIYCFGGKQIRPTAYKPEKSDTAAQRDEWGAKANDILKQSKVKEGYCVALGWASGRLVEELARQSDLHIIVLEKNTQTVQAARKQLDAWGMNGARVHVLATDLSSAQLPSYIADLVVSEDLSSAGFSGKGTIADTLLDIMRPYGSSAYLPLDQSEHTQLAAWSEKKARSGDALVKKQPGYSILLRQGHLEGASDWTHEGATSGNTYASGDKLVKGPLGVLWFGGQADNILPEWDFTHWRGPSPLVADGRMFVCIGTKLNAVDIYTGRVLWQEEIAEMKKLIDRRREYEFDSYVAAEDGVYINCGSAIVKFDPASGRKLDRIDVPMESNEDGSDAGTDFWWRKMCIEKNRLIGSAGSCLVGLDRHNGEKHWQIKSEQGRFNFVSGNEMVFAIDFPGNDDQEGSYKLMVLNADTGDLIWNKEMQVKSEADNEQPLVPKLTYGSEKDILLVTIHDRTVGAFNGETGDILWQKNIPCNDPPSQWSKPEPPILLRDLMVTHGGKLYDPLTGEEMSKRFWNGMNSNWASGGARGCGRAVAGEYLVTLRDAHASYFDISTGKQKYFRGIRSGCTNNLIPAGGLLNAINYARGCTCNYSIYTSLAWKYMPEAASWSGEN